MKSSLLTFWQQSVFTKLNFEEVTKLYYQMLAQYFDYQVLKSPRMAHSYYFRPITSLSFGILADLLLYPSYSRI